MTNAATTQANSAPFELSTPKLNVWHDGTNYCCSTTSVTIMRRINLITNNYKDVAFVVGEEPLFKLKRDQVALVLTAAFGAKNAKTLLVGKAL